MKIKHRMPMWKYIVFSSVWLALTAGLCWAVGGDPPAEARFVEDVRFTMKAGEEFVVPQSEILAAFKGTQGQPELVRFSFEPPMSGDMKISAGQFIFEPYDGFRGVEELTFIVRDEIGTLPARVLIEVQ